MSFSSTVKNELCRIETADRCCLIAELAAVIRISGTVKYINANEANAKIITENAAFARRVFSMIKKLFGVYPEVIIRRSKKLKKHISYIIILTASKGVADALGELGIYNIDGAEENGSRYASDITKLLGSSCCRRAYIRGAFLAGGSINDPEKSYHLEITSHSKSFANELCSIINSYGLNAKVIKRKSSYIIYLKEGENIVDFLNIAGAHAALMEFENIRILKEMRNNVNRIVNCETANLDKTVNASVRQIENIKYIRDNIGFDKLPKSLREIAEVRLEHSDANLKELGLMLSPPLGKSGVNHRLRKLDEISEDARRMKGEG